MMNFAVTTLARSIRHKGKTRLAAAVVPAVILVALFFARPAPGAAANQAGVEKVYVTNSLGDNITVIDLKTMRVIDNIVVGKKPHGIAAQADGRRLFTTIESEHALKFIDPRTDRITATVPLTGRPNQCAVTPNGKFVAVPIRNGNSVDIVNVAREKVVKVLPDKVPHNCYNAGDNQRMFCTSMGDDLVYLINMKNLTETETIPLGGIPRPIAVTKDEKTLFASLTELHGFVIADIPSRKVIRTVNFPPGPFAAVPLEPKTPTHGMLITPDGKQLWVAGVVDNAVFVYDIASHHVLKEIPTGWGPNWLTFSPDGKYGIVSNAGSNNVSVIDRATYKEVARVPVGKGPKRLIAIRVPAM